MTLAWFVALASIAVYGLLAAPADGAGTLDEVALRHEMKLTFCLEQRGKRFYRTENLDDLCTLKVAFFEDRVSGKIILFVTYLLVCIKILDSLSLSLSRELANMCGRSALTNI